MAGQDKLPHLPIPPLEDTMKRYIRALEGLQVSATRCNVVGREQQLMVFPCPPASSLPQSTRGPRPWSRRSWRRMDRRSTSDSSTTRPRGPVSSRSGGQILTSLMPTLSSCPSTPSSSSSECIATSIHRTRADEDFGRDDPTPARGNQLMRASSLILASLGFVHDFRTGELPADDFRGTPRASHLSLFLTLLLRLGDVQST